MLNIGTLFSGGLASVGWAMKYESFEHEVVFACEWDKYARKQYLSFHGEPSSSFYEDVSDMDGTPYKDTIDLMVWGSPCQDLSLAGKRKGFDGEKSSLFREGARIMSEVMPKVFIFENVKGLLSSNGGADYKEIIEAFQDMGYLIAMKVVNAKDQGTAQNRERVFVVGFLNEDSYHAFSFAESVPLTKSLRDYLDDRVDEKYYLSEKMIKGFIKHRERHEERGNGFKFEPKDGSEVAVCLSTAGSGRATDNYIKEPILEQIGELDIKGNESIRRVYGVGVKSATSCGYEVATENDSINFTHPNSKTRIGRVGKGVAQTLDCACNQAVIDVIPTQLGNSASRGNSVSRGNSAFCLRVGQPNGVILQDEVGFRIRRLTETECFRLMGLRNKDIMLVNSPTQSYKIACNGIEVNTMRSIIRQLYKPRKSALSLF